MSACAYRCAWCDAPVASWDESYLAWDWWVCRECFRELELEGRPAPSLRKAGHIFFDSKDGWQIEATSQGPARGDEEL